MDKIWFVSVPYQTNADDRRPVQQRPNHFCVTSALHLPQKQWMSLEAVKFIQNTNRRTGTCPVVLDCSGGKSRHVSWSWDSIVGATAPLLFCLWRFTNMFMIMIEIPFLACFLGLESYHLGIGLTSTVSASFLDIKRVSRQHMVLIVTYLQRSYLQLNKLWQLCCRFGIQAGGWYGIVGFNVPLDTLLVISETILQVR